MTRVVTRVWPRAHYTVGGEPGRVAFIALSNVLLPDPLPVSRTHHGMPEHSDGPGAIAIVARRRSDGPQWFADQIALPFSDVIASDLGAAAAARALAAQHAYVIAGEIDDPDDLGHIQAAWALAKCACEAGADLVIDVYAARAHLGSEVAALDPEREFDVMHEVTLFCDEAADQTLAAWSLGMCKFGRPDIVVLGIAHDGGTQAALLLQDVAAQLAAGERIEPGDEIIGPDGIRRVAHAFDRMRAPVVAVERTAIVLVR